MSPTTYTCIRTIVIIVTSSGSSSGGGSGGVTMCGCKSRIEGHQRHHLPQQAAVIDIHATRVKTTWAAAQQAARTHCCTTSGMATPQPTIAALLRTMLMRCEEDVPGARSKRSRGGGHAGGGAISHHTPQQTCKCTAVQTPRCCCSPHCPKLQTKARAVGHRARLRGCRCRRGSGNWCGGRFECGELAVWLGRGYSKARSDRMRRL